MKAQGLGFTGSGLGFRVWGLGFRVWGYIGIYIYIFILQGYIVVVYPGPVQGLSILPLLAEIEGMEKSIETIVLDVRFRV